MSISSNSKKYYYQFSCLAMANEAIPSSNSQVLPKQLGQVFTKLYKLSSRTNRENHHHTLYISLILKLWYSIRKRTKNQKAQQRKEGKESKNHKDIP